jgi:DNA repair protein RadC
MAGRTREVFYVLCLDSRLRVKFPAQIAQGTVKDVYEHPREVVEAALAHHASAVCLSTTTRVGIWLLHRQIIVSRDSW